MFKLDDGSKWKPIHPDREVENAWYQIDRWIAKNTLTHRTVIADNIFDLSEALNLSEHRIRTHISQHSKDTPLENWLIELKYENIPEEERKKNPKYIKGKKEALKVKTTNLETGEERIYNSIYECSKDHNTGHGALSWVINRSKTQSRNGYRFEFVN